MNKTLSKHFTSLKSIIFPNNIQSIVTAIPENQSISIDKHLSEVQLFSNEINSFKLNEDFRSFTKIHNFSIFILILNIIRNSVYILFPNDKNLLKYFSDLTIYFVSKRHFILIPF